MASKYQRLDDIQDEQSPVTEHCSNCSNLPPETFQRDQFATRRCSFRSLSVVKDLILISFAILGFVGFFRTLTSLNHHHRDEATKGTIENSITMVSCDCGNSISEALALGCKYDSLAAAWLPEHCRDDDLTAEFERSGPGVDGKWTYWNDSAHTNEISIEDISKMAENPDLRFHMTGHWHVIHCIFYWRKEHRLRSTGKIVEPRSFSEKHVKHCGNIIQDPGRDTIAGVALNTDAE